MQQTCAGSLERAPRGLPVWPTPKMEILRPDRDPGLPDRISLTGVV